MNFFTPEELSIISNAKKVVVAFSGGPDSTLALLATKESLKNSSKLSALHINHQAQTASSEWEQDCEKLCQKLSIAYESVKVKVKVEDQGFEAAARVARQKVFQQLESGTVLILGHHADDQVETVLFRIFRGTGIKGLAGMKRISKHSDLVFIRPLMGLNKSEILNCLQAVKQEFIIDESNNENIYSRNFLRNEVIPLIKEKWPNVDKSINRMAQILDQQNTLYEKLIAEKYLLLSDEEGLFFQQLSELDFFMRSEIIRFWLNQMGCAVPNESQMKEIDKSFFQSRQGANPVLKFQRDDGQNAGVVLSKYNNYLIAEKLDE